jgi:hypothetical protein
MKKFICYLSVSLAMTAFLIMIGGCQKFQPSNESKNQSLYKADEHGMQTVSREELIESLESKDFDRTVSVMNRIKRMQYQGDLLPLIKDIWEGNFLSVPNVEKTFVEHQRIRIEIADVLLQASLNNSGFKLEPSVYSNYARGLVYSDDATIATQAISVVGIAKDPTDLPLLEKLLKEENTSTYRAAAIAYTENCKVNAAAIDQIASSIKSGEIRSFLRELWSGMQEIRPLSCPSFALNQSFNTDSAKSRAAG